MMGGSGGGSGGGNSSVGNCCSGYFLNCREIGLASLMESLKAVKLVFYVDIHNNKLKKIRVIRWGEGSVIDDVDLTSHNFPSYECLYVSSFSISDDKETLIVHLKTCYYHSNDPRRDCYESGQGHHSLLIPDRLDHSPVFYY